MEDRITRQLNRIGGSKFSIILSAVALAVGVVALMFSFGREKIGVVRTADLVAKYKGMEDARKAFEEQKKIWQSEIDTLEADFRKSVSDLNTEWKKLSKAEQEKRRELAATQEQNLMRYTQSLEARVYEEEGRLSEKVLSQVNEVVRRYAEENDFDVIYGATIEGSILHSTEALDITDELLEVLNNEYDPTKAEDTAVR